MDGTTVTMAPVGTPSTGYLAIETGGQGTWSASAAEVGFTWGRHRYLQHGDGEHQQRGPMLSTVGCAGGSRYVAPSGTTANVVIADLVGGSTITSVVFADKDVPAFELTNLATAPPPPPSSCPGLRSRV